MPDGKLLRRVAVKGLNGSNDYALEFETRRNTKILIAPNGYGKTAFLTLLRDCLGLNLARAATRTFDELEITFSDKTRWRFDRKHNADIARQRRAWRARTQAGARYADRAHANPYWVDLTRYDKSGKKIKEELPDLNSIEARNIFRTIERLEPWVIHQADLFDERNGPRYSSDYLRKYFELAEDDESIRRAISVTNPKFIWPEISRVPSLFIETQRLLYSDSSPGSENQAPKEEILRQKERLSEFLQKSYGDYASTSQSLDRSFPNRLIRRASSGENIDASSVREQLKEIEEKRAELTEAGILVEQADAITPTDDALFPAVLSALQIYVEDSKQKLATYDELFPKLSLFKDLLSNKLMPKKVEVGREFGVRIHKEDDVLPLGALSSGEKHEFIMLFKLIFETKPGTLVLIDEPEISLHVVWQLEFMSDLQKIQELNPFQCIIATHSPQIFQGFEDQVVDLADQGK